MNRRDPHRRRTGLWFGHGRTRALLSAGLLVGTGAVATSAFWADRAEVAGATISAGTLHVDLESNYRQRPESIVGWSELDLAGLTPGTTKAALMTVTNNSRGQLPVSFRLQASATGALGSALEVTVRRGGTLSGSGCSSGTVLGGSPDAGLNGFDAPGGTVLATGQSTELCIQVSLPAGASVAPSSTSIVTFTVPAKQEMS
ncbi:hypothetical protein [Nocardioides sp. J54]|uniref:hypothetical protein n=1 Tax=Nocardioides sp. J54 TaxID=935866 RepID=UPI00048B0B9E|nr:hypothetical protein [Nocardioides sp. J54]